MPDGHWYRFMYCSVLNVLNLLICLVGAGLFAKTTVFVLAMVVLCLGVTFSSYFIQNQLEVRLMLHAVEEDKIPIFKCSLMFWYLYVKYFRLMHFRCQFLMPTTWYKTALTMYMGNILVSIRPL